MKLIMATTIATTMALTSLLAAGNEAEQRLEDAAVVFSEVMSAPDQGIPHDCFRALRTGTQPHSDISAESENGRSANPLHFLWAII